MNRPIFVDTSHLTEAQKCVLALEQALAHGHSEYRIHELKEIKHIVLCGDSIFDNQPYINAGEQNVTKQVESLLSEGSASRS